MHINHKSSGKEQGFTLFELMIAITIIAILTAIGIPAYQNYIQKAALIDMLQFMSLHKIAVELCILEKGNSSNCNKQNIAISNHHRSRYVSNVTVDSGVITLSGNHSLAGLNVTMTPILDNNDNSLTWQRSCQTLPNNPMLEKNCYSLFKD